MEALIIIAAIFAVLSFLLHRSANKAEQKFANRPSVIKILQRIYFQIKSMQSSDYLQLFRGHLL